MPITYLDRMETDNPNLWILFQDGLDLRDPIDVLTYRQGLRYLGDSRPSKPWTPYYRVPWLNITDKDLQSCNLSFNLNPDMRVDFDCKDRLVTNPMLMQVFWDLKCDAIVKKIICVYEYGKQGKQHGKLHFHGICQLQTSPGGQARQIFEKNLLKVFGKRSQCHHRTLVTKLFKTVEDRSRYVTYMKKETQNKKKTLCFIK